MFFGKQSKPVWRYRFQNEAKREKAIREAFQDRKARQDRMAGYRKERTDFVPTYKVGDIFKTCWGYDQTNVEYFEIVEIKGKFATLREIAQERQNDSSMSGRCVPLPGEFLKPRFEGGSRGLPIRRLMTQHGVKIDDVRYASPASATTVAGVRVVSPGYWSSYH